MHIVQSLPCSRWCHILLQPRAQPVLAMLGLQTHSAWQAGPSYQIVIPALMPISFPVPNACQCRHSRSRFTTLVSLGLPVLFRTAADLSSHFTAKLAVQNPPRRPRHAQTTTRKYQWLGSEADPQTVFFSKAS